MRKMLGRKGREALKRGFTRFASGPKGKGENKRIFVLVSVQRGEKGASCATETLCAGGREDIWRKDVS